MNCFLAMLVDPALQKRPADWTRLGLHEHAPCRRCCIQKAGATIPACADLAASIRSVTPYRRVLPSCWQNPLLPELSNVVSDCDAARVVTFGDGRSLSCVRWADLHRSVQSAVDVRQVCALCRLRPVPELVPEGEKVSSENWDII